MSKKTYRELAPLEALKKLADNGGPIEEIWLKDTSNAPWLSYQLIGVNLSVPYPFSTSLTAFRLCAELIETAPEPWDFESVPAAYCWLRPKMNLGNDAHYTFSAAYKSHITLRIYGDVGYTDLAAEWEHSFDRVNWLPCTK